MKNRKRSRRMTALSELIVTHYIHINYCTHTIMYSLLVLS